MKYSKNKKKCIFRDYENLSTEIGYVATIGNYDGVHIGHQYILKQVTQYQKKTRLPSLIITFEPSPSEYFLQTRAAPRLTSFREKAELFFKYGIENILCLRFDKDLANMPAQRFIQEILINKLHIKYLVTGDDFAFGNNRIGGFEMLQEYTAQDLITEKIPSISAGGTKASSTHIRQALAAGNFKLAKLLLGRPYSISGHVAHGKHLGHLLGFPTANIYLRQKTTPLNGVYAAKVKGIGSKTLNSLVNIGFRPTVDGTNFILEVHILDFNKNIYGKKLKIEFLQKIRDEKKFANLELLRQQIAADVDKGKTLFKNKGNFGVVE